MDFALLALAFIVASLIFILSAAIYGQYEEGVDLLLCSKCGSVMDGEKDSDAVCWRCGDATEA